MSDEAFLILNVADCDQWPLRHGNCNAIPAGRAPTLLHTVRADAEVELLRLARHHPEGRFVLFQATALGMCINAPSHVTLGGQVVRTESVARLARIGDEVPF